MRTKGLLKRRILKLLTMTALLTFLCGAGASAASKTVNMQKKSSTFSYVGQCGSGTTVYHKFSLSKPSYVMVTGAESLTTTTIGMQVTLCNRKKKALDSAQDVNLSNPASSSTFAEYALAKGIYYIKVSNAGRYGLVIGTANKVGKIKITDPGGKSKSKAKTIKKKKTVAGIIAAGDSKGKADWFKFKVTKKKVLKFKLYAEGTSMVNFTLYGPSYKKGRTMAKLRNNGVSLRTINKWSGKSLKVTPGTYYIRVRRSSGYKKKAKSAVYYINWR